MAKAAKRKRAKPAAKGTAGKTAARKRPARTATPKAPKKKATAKAAPRATPGEALDLYRRMLLIRRFEEKAGQLYGMGLISGFCHLYIGQEAVVVGMTASAGDDDTLVTSYRDPGHMLAG
ncbi:MAG: thiamine pyrophosphate-dependent enzyme, partial [Rhodospirillales bacterium]